MDLSIIIPTYNEAPNVAELVARIDTVLAGTAAEIVFIDDSSDDTVAEIERAAAAATLPVRVVHRNVPTGGLGGAVLAGIALAQADVCVVMDADLQHPPEDIPRLWARYRLGGVDMVIASRYAGDGDAEGLADRTRVLVSKASTALTKAMFPVRLRDVSDPMTGFFLVDKSTLDLAGLKPRGFKILLEILARRQVRVTEVPFRFADRHAGASKASPRQGFHFLTQLTALRFGKMSIFAVIGGLGALANLGIIWVLTSFGVHYMAAAIIAAEATIIGNFLLQERFVFHDMTADASSRGSRFLKSFAFNNAEALIRLPLLALLVERWHWSVVIATGATLLLAFVVRFVFHSLVVYAPRTSQSRVSRVVRELDKQATQPGEL